MKIKITCKLISRRNGNVLGVYEHTYDNYKDAFDYIIESHEDAKTYQATFLQFDKEIIYEED